MKLRVVRCVLLDLVLKGGVGAATAACPRSRLPVVVVLPGHQVFPQVISNAQTMQSMASA